MNEKILFENEWVTVFQRKWETLDHEYTLIRPREGAGVSILPLRVVGEEVEVLMVSQPRPPEGGLLWEFPAGGVDAGEKPLSAAVRELGEETNIWVEEETLISLGSHHIFPSLVEEILHVYACVLPEDYDYSKVKPEVGEINGIQWVNVKEAFVKCASDPSYSFVSLGKLVLLVQHGLASM